MIYFDVFSYIELNMSIGGSTGQVLGASTGVVAGVAMLPYTGTDSLSAILPMVAIATGVIVLCTFVATRFIRKLS